MADANTHAAPIRILAISDGQIERLFALLARNDVPDVASGTPTVFSTENGLLGILGAGRCDLIICYIGNVRWNIPPHDQTSQRILDAVHRFKRLHPDRQLLPQRLRDIYARRIYANIDAGVSALIRIRRDYGVPILATQGMDLGQRFVGTGVVFLPAPSTPLEITAALREALSGAGPALPRNAQ